MKYIDGSILKVIATLPYGFFVNILLRRLEFQHDLWRIDIRHKPLYFGFSFFTFTLSLVEVESYTEMRISNNAETYTAYVTYILYKRYHKT